MISIKSLEEVKNKAAELGIDLSAIDKEISRLEMDINQELSFENEAVNL